MSASARATRSGTRKILSANVNPTSNGTTPPQLVSVSLIKCGSHWKKYVNARATNFGIIKIRSASVLPTRSGILQNNSASVKAIRSGMRMMESASAKLKAPWALLPF